jgi:hypothetical protein
MKFLQHIWTPGISFEMLKTLVKVKQATTGKFAVPGAVNWLFQDSLQCCAVNSVFGDFGGKTTSRCQDGCVPTL